MPSLFRPAFRQPAARCFIELLPSQELLDVGLGVVLVFLVPRLDEVQVVNCLANTVDWTQLHAFFRAAWGEACSNQQDIKTYKNKRDTLLEVKHFFMRSRMFQAIHQKHSQLGNHVGALVLALALVSPCLGANGAMTASNHDDLCRTVLQGGSPWR